ncbi:hypothetical protein LXL04_037514 [Taraxacum kok-saghyz]
MGSAALTGLKRVVTGKSRLALGLCYNGRLQRLHFHRQRFAAQVMLPAKKRGRDGVYRRQLPPRRTMPLNSTTTPSGKIQATSEYIGPFIDHVVYRHCTRAVQMRTIIGGGNGGTNLGHLFQFAADQFSDAGALLSAQHIKTMCISLKNSSEELEQKKKKKQLHNGDGPNVPGTRFDHQSVIEIESSMASSMAFLRDFVENSKFPSRPQHHLGRNMFDKMPEESLQLAHCEMRIDAMMISAN